MIEADVLYSTGIGEAGCRFAAWPIFFPLEIVHLAQLQQALECGSSSSQGLTNTVSLFMLGEIFQKPKKCPGLSQVEGLAIQSVQVAHKRYVPLSPCWNSSYGAG